MMADGVMYNGIDLTRADGNKYLFRSIFLAEEEEDDEDRMWEVSINDKEEEPQN